MKIEETSTASRSRPPPFPRRSSRIASAPRRRSLSISLRRKPCAPWLNVVSSTTPIFFPLRSTIRPCTTGTSIRARRTVRVRGTPLSGSTTSSRTFVPDGPLMRAVATLLATPAIERPLTAVMNSPFLIPARSAGEPSNTLITCRPRRSSSTFIPTPSNSPRTDCSNCLVSSGVR